jgi:hypothetical protein
MKYFVFGPSRIYASMHSRLALQSVEASSNYLHRSPASRKRRRKGNPVPVDINGPPYSWGIQIREPGPPVWGSLESKTVKCGHGSRRTLTWELLRWRAPAAFVNDSPILSSERMLHKDYDRKCSTEKKKSGRDPQGAWCQDELTGGKPPVVK